MNRISKLFSGKSSSVLSVYFTAGFPSAGDTAGILAGLQEAGVDMAEIGIPFSDPLADGPVIQKSSEVALSNGMSLKRLLGELKELQLGNSPMAVLLMGYLNPVLQYGMENFCRDAAAAGISGIILPDLPFTEYMEEYKDIFDRHQLKNIFLITPQTPEERIRMIDSVSDSFIYLVSSSSTTGAKSGISPEQENYFSRIRSMNLKNPLMIGFGISNGDSFRKACSYANGAIIGSAFISHLGKGGNVKEFIQSIKG